MSIESTIYKETCINSSVIELGKDFIENLASEGIDRCHCREEDFQGLMKRLNLRPVDAFVTAKCAVEKGLSYGSLSATVALIYMKTR